MSTDSVALLRAWEQEPAVDHHCHPLRRWPFQLTALELRAAFTEAIDPRIPTEHVLQTAGYRAALRRLGEALGCDPTEAGILEQRNRAEPAEYANRLLQRTNSGLLLLDYGFSAGDTFAPDEHARVVRVPQREIVRVETLAERLVADASDPREWLAAVRAALRRAVQAGAVGVKTICAYRAGLRLRPVDTDQLGVAFTMLRHKSERHEPIRLTGAAMCHALVFEAAAECCALGVPLQVHCGFGDPDEDLADASPLGLRPLLQDAQYAGLRLALLHCYPYHREAAYLCAVYPDVSMDLSLAIPMAGADGAQALKEALGLCPFSKLLYATDATRYPEVYLVAALAYRDALAAALAELFDTATALDAGRQVLAANARRLYPLDA
jgi:predicted TIM-barrel fold metal-dependent hydrolase